MWFKMRTWAPAVKRCILKHMEGKKINPLPCYYFQIPSFYPHFPSSWFRAKELHHEDKCKAQLLLCGHNQVEEQGHFIFKIPNSLSLFLISHQLHFSLVFTELFSPWYSCLYCSCWSNLRAKTKISLSFHGEERWRLATQRLAAQLIVSFWL